MFHAKCCGFMGTRACIVEEQKKSVVLDGALSILELSQQTFNLISLQISCEWWFRALERN